MKDDGAAALAIWAGAVTGFVIYGWLKSVEFRRMFRRAWERIPADRRRALRDSLLAEEGIE